MDENQNECEAKEGYIYGRSYRKSYFHRRHGAGGGHLQPWPDGARPADTQDAACQGHLDTLLDNR